MQISERWSDEILEKFLGKLNGFGCVVLGVGRFGFADFFAEVAGFFTAERIDDRFGNGCFLRVGDQHVRPSIELHHGIRSADELQATESDEQILEKPFQEIRC